MPAQPELVANDVLAPASLAELAVQRLRSEILSGHGGPSPPATRLRTGDPQS